MKATEMRDLRLTSIELKHIYSDSALTEGKVHAYAKQHLARGCEGQNITIRCAYGDVEECLSFIRRAATANLEAWEVCRRS